MSAQNKAFVQLAAGVLTLKHPILVVVVLDISFLLRTVSIIHAVVRNLYY